MPSRGNRFIAVLLAAAILTPAGALYAQPKRVPLRQQLPDDAARKQYDAAVDLAKHNNWDGARTAFTSLYQSTKNPRVLFNVAVAEKSMGRYAAAIATYKRELDEGKGTLQPDEIAEINQQVAGLAQFVGQLEIEVSEPGADVTVDDERVDVTKGPISVQLGTRKVRATKAGYAEAVEQVEVKGGETKKVSLKLLSNQRTSVVQITVVGPQSADILVDGKVVGQATAQKPYEGQVLVSPEPHNFTAQAPGWVPTTQPMTVHDGEKTVFTIQLAKDQQKGKLVINTVPEGGTISIDGSAVGSSHWEGPVDAGPHQVTVTKQGFYTANYDLEVPKGGDRSLTATLNENRNTSFVPWLIGTVVVIGASATALYFITRPKDQDPVNGTLNPYSVGTTGVHFR
jgi:hypothetical protein